jgi:hypothetical protein
MASMRTAGQARNIGGPRDDDRVGLDRHVQAVRRPDGDQARDDLADADAHPYVVGRPNIGQTSAPEDLQRHGQVEGNHAAVGEDGDTMHLPIVARFRRSRSRQPLFGTTGRP